jgi:hypothetical protein
LEKETGARYNSSSYRALGGAAALARAGQGKPRQRGGGVHFKVPGDRGECMEGSFFANFLRQKIVILNLKRKYLPVRACLSPLVPP